MREQTCLLTYDPFFVQLIDTRSDANIHKAFACRYPPNNIYTVVEELTHGYLCFGPRHTSTSWCGWLRKGGVFWFLAHDLGLRDGNCIDLFADTGLCLSMSKRYLFLFNAGQSLSTLHRS